MEGSRLKRAALDRLTAAGIAQPTAYQPEHLFRKNGRKLARVAEPEDPWLVYGCYGDRCVQEIDADPREAARRLIARFNLPVLYDLGVEIDNLTGAIRGSG